MSITAPKKWTQKGFLLAAFILAFSAVGLNFAVAFLQLHFIKLPVPMNRELSTVPSNLGHWLQVSKDEPLDRDVQDSLATEHYIFRDFVDTRLVSNADLAQFEGKGSAERRRLVTQLQMNQPDAVINLAVTYYTGKVDTVAHIPERCYVADGYQPSAHETVTWDLGPTGPTKDGPDRKVEVRYINFEDQTGAARVTKRVAYFFYVDGQYQSDPVGVRTTLADLWARHGFYSKVELMTIIPDHDKSARVMTDFLSTALPEIEKCYPDWNSVEGVSVKK
jgi:hypothetical protein